jgi:DNA primase
VKIRCPFHPDEEPSCSVNLAKRLFPCFSCRAAGNALEFVHRMEARDGSPVTLRQAGVTLAGICGERPAGGGEAKAHQGRLEGRGKAVEGGTAQAPPAGPPARPGAPAGRGEGDPGQEEKAKRNNKPLGFALPLDPSHPYLTERGIPPGLIEAFGLGYCGKGIMAGRVCVPIHDADGRTVAYAGRRVGSLEDLPEGKGRYELPAGFRKELELFNLSRVAHCRHVVVVEGFFGAIHLHGLRTPAVALMGTSVSEAQLELLAHANARHVTVMLDGDKPGREAAEEVAGAIANVAWSRIVHLADGVQPDTIDRAQLERLLGRGHG